MTKRQWKKLALAHRSTILAQSRTIRDLKRQLDESGPPRRVVPSFDNLEVCWSKRTVTKSGRTITADPISDYFVIPITGSRYVITDTKP